MLRRRKSARRGAGSADYASIAQSGQTCRLGPAHGALGAQGAKDARSPCRPVLQPGRRRGDGRRRNRRGCRLLTCHDWRLGQRR